MRKALITVVADQVSEPQMEQLDEIVRRNYKQHVSQEKLQTIWCRVPHQQMFTDYQDSQSSLITMECQTGFPQEQRVVMLSALLEEWRTVTNQHPDHLLLALLEEDKFKTLLSANQDRFNAVGKLQFAMRMAAAFLRSKISGKPMNFNPNL